MDSTTPRAWSTALRDRARRRDRRRGIDTSPKTDDPLVEGWAIARLAALGATAPVWGPPLIVGSAVNHSRATRRSAAFASQLDRIDRGRPPLAPANRTARLDGRRRIVVVSDLHRAIPGPCDWPHRQGAVPVIDAMYAHYASEGWTLCENGDIEEFWMVGGTSEGVTYDVTRLAGATADALGRPRPPRPRLPGPPEVHHRQQRLHLPPRTGGLRGGRSLHPAGGQPRRSAAPPGGRRGPE